MHKNYSAYLFLLPSLALVLIFNYIPIGQALYRSFYQWRGGSLAKFVGLDNYAELFKDRAFGIAVLNQLKLMLFHVIVILTVPLFAAETIFGLRTRPQLQHFFRVLFVVPMVVPTMVVLLIWSFIYDGEVGLLNAILKGIGLGKFTKGWLAEPSSALYAVMGVGFPWVSGTAVLIWDAARLDGVRGMRRFFHIDLHLILGQVKLMLILTVINQTQHFVGVLVLTGGGPGWSTLVPGLYLYQNAFMHARMGYANAVGVILFIFLMIVTVIQMRVIRTRE